NHLEREQKVNMSHIRKLLQVFKYQKLEVYNASKNINSLSIDINNCLQDELEPLI
ncbi:39966_t:CDS:1, partial [Gigaspora margarita]